MRIKIHCCCWCLLLGLASLTLPLAAEPPPGYYQSADGLSGDDLRRALHEIISGHDAMTYTAVREAIAVLDEDPANADNVVLIYSRASVPKDAWGEYNREQLWPQSLGARRHPAKSDLHHIFAADSRVNSSRGNKPFGDCGSDCRHHPSAPRASYNRDLWEPPDEVKGDVARALFYMDIRYDGDDGEHDLALTDGETDTGCDCMGRLTTLVLWHRLDPVDARERARNDRIYLDYQDNRNPFVDHPEWIDSIWPVSLPPPGWAEPETGTLTVCSFNIQFLGNSRERDNAGLAELVEGYDVVVVQELVAPPYEGLYPDGTAFRPDPEAREFFEEMQALGFDYVLSEEDTGTGDAIHHNGSATEWWVAFYDPDKVQRTTSLPGGFLAQDRSNHPDYERVPYAFPFATVDENFDFVLISVHLKPDASAAARRRHELDSIAGWIDDHAQTERDFIILGDMNIEDSQELLSATPSGFRSLNAECAHTNTNPNRPRPYDHVMINPDFTTEVDDDFGLQVVDLISAMRPYWTSDEPYPGSPYDHNRFRRHYSDHHPILFKLRLTETDDD